MAEKSHFKNCSLTEFAVGMRVEWCGHWYIAKWVDKDGDAHSSMDPDNGAGCPVLFLTNLPQYTLDLDPARIWIGRQYRHDPGGDNFVIVRLLSDDLIVYYERGINICCSRLWFLANFFDLPLELPAEAKPEWKAEAGKECLYEEEEGKPVKVKVLHVQDWPDDPTSDAWIDNDEISKIVSINWLRPLSAPGGTTNGKEA